MDGWRSQNREFEQISTIYADYFCYCPRGWTMGKSARSVYFAKIRDSNLPDRDPNIQRINYLCHR